MLSGTICSSQAAHWNGSSANHLPGCTLVCSVDDDQPAGAVAERTSALGRTGCAPVPGRGAVLPRATARRLFFMK